MKNIKFRLTVFLLFCVVPIIVIVLMSIGLVSLLKVDNNVEQIRHQKETIAAYRAVLHRIWLENPSYMGDYFVETDEMFVLDSLDNAMLHNIFTTHSALEKEEYEYNRAHEAEHIIIRHDPGCCTVNIK